MSAVLFNKTLLPEDYESLNSSFYAEQEKCRQLFVEKNVRYEASFFKQIEEDGSLMSLTMRLTDKLNRAKALIKNPDMSTADESIKDTLRDLANYAVMGLTYLEVVENKGEQ